MYSNDIVAISRNLYCHRRLALRGACQRLQFLFDFTENVDEDFVGLVGSRLYEVSLAATQRDRVSTREWLTV